MPVWLGIDVIDGALFLYEFWHLGACTVVWIWTLSLRVCAERHHGSKPERTKKDHAEQHLPAIVFPFPLPPFLMPSLSPRSVCSCIRSSTLQSVLNSIQRTINSHILYLLASASTASPWTTFSRKNFAISPACAIRLDVSSLPSKRLQLWSKFLRTSYRAAVSVLASPVMDALAWPEFGEAGARRYLGTRCVSIAAGVCRLRGPLSVTLDCEDGMGVDALVELVLGTGML